MVLLCFLKSQAKRLLEARGRESWMVGASRCCSPTLSIWPPTSYNFEEPPNTWNQPPTSLPHTHIFGFEHMHPNLARKIVSEGEKIPCASDMGGVTPLSSRTPHARPKKTKKNKVASQKWINFLFIFFFTSRYT